MSPQDAMMHLKNMHNGAGAGGDPFKEGPYPKGKKPPCQVVGPNLKCHLKGQKVKLLLSLRKVNLTEDMA